MCDIYFKDDNYNIVIIIKLYYTNIYSVHIRLIDNYNIVIVMKQSKILNRFRVNVFTFIIKINHEQFSTTQPKNVDLNTLIRN